MQKTYDIAVLGAGPGGYVAAIRAAQLGMSVCLIEKQGLGGVCLHAGCIPTKFLLKNVHLIGKLKHLEASGISFGNLDVDFKLMQQKKKDVIENLRKGIEYLLKRHNVDVVYGYGSFLNENSIDVEGQKINFKNAIIAVGSHPVDLPNIKFDKEKGVLSSCRILELEEIPKSLLIIGGGAIGCEFADIFSGLGSEVKIVELTGHILPSEDADAARILEREFKKRRIQIFTGTKVTNLEGDSKKGFKAVLEKGSMLNAEKILLAIGRAPNSQKGGIKKIGVKLLKGKITVNSFMQTNISNIYAIGDVVGRTNFAHAASQEAIIAVETIAGLHTELDYNLVPRCVYTHPELASVGLNESAAREKNIEIKISKFPLTANARAQVEGEKQGLAKFIVEAKEGKILGATLVMVHAGEIIHEVCVAMSSGMKIAEFMQIIHAHPTISESLIESAEMAESKAIHIV